MTTRREILCPVKSARSSAVRQRRRPATPRDSGWFVDPGTWDPERVAGWRARATVTQL